MADIVLIQPKFHPTYWGFDYALPMFRKTALLPPLNLALLAALTPAGHTVTLIDENVEPIDFERCRRADIVGVTGMAVQRFRMREILAELKARGVFTVVGGPWAPSSEDYFDALADVIFIGEAEETWPRFLAEWERGPPPVPLRAGREDRHDEGADAAVRPAQDAALRLRQRAVLARLPVPVRVLRHHRHLRPPAADQERPADHRRAGGAARRRNADVVHRRRQPDRQQEGDQGGPPRRHRLAGGERLSADLLHRGLDRPGRRPRADGADGRGEHRHRLHRHREAQRGVAPRDQEIPERADRSGTLLEKVHRIQDAGISGAG